LILAEFGPFAREAVPPLCALLNSTSSAEAEAAAYALGRICDYPDIAVPSLARKLASDDTAFYAASALGEFGAQAKIAVPELLALTRKPEGDTHESRLARVYAELSLWRILSAEDANKILRSPARLANEPYFDTYTRAHVKFLVGKIALQDRVSRPPLH
jgi:hypothetical protein